MPVEIFENDSDPTTSLVISIFNDGIEIVPAWWIEMQDKEYYDLADISAILECLPVIKLKLEQLLEIFDGY